MDTAIVVGGGQSGLAAACALRSHGFQPTVLEEAREPVGSWPKYYDSLELLSPAVVNSLPGMPFPGDPARFPSRDEVIDYLRHYAARLDCDIRTGQHVVSVVRDGDGFLACTEAGGRFHAPVLVAATGSFTSPHRPDVGLDAFTGTVLHSSEYRSPKPFAGQRVVVVGAGESGVQIAVDLAKHAHVTLATRRPVRLTPSFPGGDSVAWRMVRKMGWLPLGSAVVKLMERYGAVIDTSGTFQSAIAAGRPDRREMFLAGEGNEIRWRDGRREHVDTVLLATGYRPSLEYLRPLGAIDRAGRPRHRFGLSTTHHGLAFVGLPGQRAFHTMAIGGVGWDACYVARRLRHEMASREMRCCRRSSLRGVSVASGHAR